MLEKRDDFTKVTTFPNLSASMKQRMSKLLYLFCKIFKPLLSNILVITLCGCTGFTLSAQEYSPYLQVIKEQGLPPVAFVKAAFKNHDLVIFDDALHPAAEPFDFYRELLTESQDIDYVFLEVLGIQHQSHIDRYLSHQTPDSTLLIPVFQNDFIGYGWRYRTYLELLSTVWHLNKKLNRDIKVIAVDQPIYWDAIQTREDYDIFQKSLKGRDYFMYRIILETMGYFERGHKGIFLTNTRHAYKAIRNSKGSLYWNTGTFFHQWHPGKSYSIRIHNAVLAIKNAKKVEGSSSTEGLDRLEYWWVKMEDGLWDGAFELNHNRQVGIPLLRNPFGEALYIGNHMLDIQPEQTMYDAYDGLIFLAPLKDMHFSATMGFFYTSEFQMELKRRITLLHGGDLSRFLKDNKAGTWEEFLEQLVQPTPRKLNNLIEE